MTCGSIFISCPQQANPQKQKVDSRDEKSGLLIFFVSTGIVFHTLVRPVPHNGKTEFYTQ